MEAGNAHHTNFHNSDDFTDGKFTQNAMTVLERRYLKKDMNGKVTETPEQMFRRVAKNIASAETRYGSDSVAKKVEEEFYNIMVRLEFLPNSPTLMNAGRELQQLSACFVLPVEDAMDGIFTSLKNAALIHKSGGGTGFSFSRLRPKNDKVLSTGGIASGPVSFMKVFNSATEAVKQGGTRRGANMGILRVDHPDILEFIASKQDTEELTNFNISVALTEKFMKAVERGDSYDLVNPRTGVKSDSLNAKEVFDKIVEMSWQSGEPGIIFIDRINRDNPTPSEGEVESTNPCGEQPLLPYESCNLGSVNLAKMVCYENGTAKIDWYRLERVVKLAIRFLDNVIDMNRYPLPEIEKMTLKNRKVGLGVMGFADLLIQLRVPYNSDEAMRVAENLMKFMHEKAIEASCELARPRGTFPSWKKSIYSARHLKLRNATLTTIAPTGTLSIIAGCSSGIEPLFAVSYTRTVLDNDKLVEVNPFFEREAREGDFYEKSLMERIASEGSLKNIGEVPENLKRLYVTAHDITPEWHVRMQAAFQRHTDNAVSKTVNFSHDATKEDVRKVFLLAYKDGCKGVTIYRDRSRDKQVLSTQKVVKKNGFGRIVPRPRPMITTGTTEKSRIGCGNLYITVNADSEGICEVFAETGRYGGCSSQSEAISRLISLALRCGISADAVVDQLRGIKCPSASRNKAPSCPDAISKAIERYGKLREVVKLDEIAAKYTSMLPEPDTKQTVFGEHICPECGSKLNFIEGCRTCMRCGYTKCW